MMRPLSGFDGWVRNADLALASVGVIGRCGMRACCCPVPLPAAPTSSSSTTVTDCSVRRVARRVVLPYVSEAGGANESRLHRRTLVDMAKGPQCGEGHWNRATAEKAYEKELFRLQAEWSSCRNGYARRARLVVVFEGRDAAGKGSTIKRVSEYLNPRLARIAALPAPTERERSQWYFQRYIGHFPAAGEIVLFDRSWYKGRRRTGDGFLYRRSTCVSCTSVLSSSGC